jgi:peptide/nickel transport system permease protein
MNLILQDLLIIAAFAAITLLLLAGTRNERWQRALRRFRRDRLGMVSLVVVLLYLGIGFLEMVQIPDGHGGARSLLGWLTAGVPAEKTFSAPLAKKLLNPAKVEPLNGLHLLGTDALGKDVLVETLRACKTALLIGGLTSAIYLPVGTLLGIMAGYFRRRTDDVIQYVYSTVASIPTILLLVSIIMVLGKSVGSMSVALGATGWVGICRLMRGETLRQAERPFVAAARCVGQSHWKIITRHLLPNVMHLVLINFVLGFSGLVLSEAILSYLGVGSPVGTPSWGSMIDQARSELSREPLVWWNLTAASAALFGLVLSLNLLGDSLRRAFDPKAA